MDIKEWLYKTTDVIVIGQIELMELRPTLVCNDGFEISVQASNCHYCTPRENLMLGEYKTVELGFPSYEEPLINSYAEDPLLPTETVYPYVPIDLVQKVIEKHGGIKEN